MFHLFVLFLVFLTLWYIVFVRRSVSSTTAAITATAMEDPPFRRHRRRENHRENENENDDGEIIASFEKNALTLRRAIVARRSTTRPILDRMVDCDLVTRYCATDDDCSILCRRYKRVRFVCNDATMTCQPTRIETTTTKRHDDNNNDGDDREDECDTKRGEYSLLVGYTNLGIAIWQCVQLYQQYADRAKYCEGGTFDMDADRREPSYRDCQCPSGSRRAVYNISNFYDNGLPHCVPDEHWDFYKNNMLPM